MRFSLVMPQRVARSSGVLNTRKLSRRYQASVHRHNEDSDVEVSYTLSSELSIELLIKLSSEFSNEFSIEMSSELSSEWPSKLSSELSSKCRVSVEQMSNELSSECRTSYRVNVARVIERAVNRRKLE